MVRVRQFRSSGSVGGEKPAVRPEFRIRDITAKMYKFPGNFCSFQLKPYQFHLLRSDSLLELCQQFLQRRPAVSHLRPVRDTQQQVKVIAHDAMREHLNPVSWTPMT